MRKIWGCCAAVLSRVIFIGFGVQIVLGILWMCSAFTSLQGFGEGIVCVGQILLAVCASFFFLRSLGLRSLRMVLLGSLAAVTFPMVMQCHMAEGISSVLSSVLLLLAGGIARTGKRGKLWLRLVLASALGGIAACLCIFWIGGRSPGSCMASRFAWPTLYDDYGSWDEEYKEKIRFDVTTNSSYEAVGIEKVMLPHLRETVGSREAERLLRGIAAAAGRRHAPGILKQIVWDAAGYALPPAVVPLQLQGRAYDSYTGANYNQVLRPNPRLGKKYMDYGCWWFKTGLTIAVILLILGLRRIDFRSWAAVFLPGCVMVLLYTMQGAGQMDYRNTVYILYVWISAMIFAAWRSAEPSGGTADEESA